MYYGYNRLVDIYAESLYNVTIMFGSLRKGIYQEGDETMTGTDVDVDVIDSREKFLARVEIGSMFWHMSSRHYKPYTIEGPYRVLGFVERGKQQFLNVKCMKQNSGYHRHVEYYSVNDLTNEHHGVFLDEKKAWAYFKERKKNYVHNPDLEAQESR